ncbi:MAG: hypothetical protein GY820_00030 [Gammaproteobacteria bacterium]|nr:hypothetical protein [Gammaproteobacteria bacterium]
MKSVSVTLQKILLLFHCHFRNYCGAISNNGGPAAFWSIFDSLNALRKIRQVNKVVDIKTYDFSSMFTNIPHAVLIRSLFSLAELCFRNAGGNKIVNIGFKKAYFADTAKSKRTFKLEEVKQLIKDVVTEAYVDFAGKNITICKNYRTSAGLLSSLAFQKVFPILSTHIIEPADFLLFFGLEKTIRDIIILF